MDVEIVISEQNEKPYLENKLKNVKYVYSYYKKSKEISDYDPGLIRNLAVENSTGEFVYTNDADVVFF